MKRCALLLLALLPLCAAVGDFESPVPLAVGASTGWLSLINGNQELSNPAANLCGFTIKDFAAQRKTVALLEVPSAAAAAKANASAAGSTTFSLCWTNSTRAMTLHLLSCPGQLEEADGSDAIDAGCTCEAGAELGQAGAKCPQADGSGLALTVTTKPGHFYYAMAQLVQAQAPLTGEEPGSKFLVAATPEGAALDEATLGLFTSPIALAPADALTNGTSTGWLSLADGHLEVVDPAVGSVCFNYPLSDYTEQRKLVVGYREVTESGSTFALCWNGIDWDLELWMLSCPRPLAQPAGADARDAGCTCLRGDMLTAEYLGYNYTCPGDTNGRQATQATQAGWSYYALVQAPPRDTGDEEGRQFALFNTPLGLEEAEWA